MSSDTAFPRTTELPGTIGHRTGAIRTVAIGGRPLASWMRLLGQQCMRSLREHALFVALVVVYVSLGWAMPRLTDVPFAYSPSLYSTNLLLFTAAFLAFGGFAAIVYVMICVRPPQLLRYLATALFERVLTGSRLWSFAPVFLLLPVVMSTFTYFKVLIPHIRPFDLDPLFAETERIVHLGWQPWELLQPLLGYPLVTAAVNFIYHLWVFVLFGVLLWQGFSLSRPRLRMRYLITFVLLWALLGNVAATVLSSAGPVYYGRVTGLADPFAPLMAYLHQASQLVWLPALDVQEMLWEAYANSDLDVGRGISAMPSLHVATSLSFALLGFSVNRWLGIAFAVFAGAIFVGSIHLGWHYAMDGYVAAVGTLAIWWSVGWFLRRKAIVRLLWENEAAAQGTS
jgi:hypothetical protein